jgi:transcriptional regulator with XRE-family HTH domain
VGGTIRVSSSTTSLADKVRQARLEAGLTQAQLAGGEVDPVTIHRIESGRVNPTRRVLSHIARRTGKSIRFFLDDSGPDEGEIDCALQKGCVRRAAGDLETAQRHFELAETLAVEASDASRAARARLELAAARVQRRWTPEYEYALVEAQVAAARFGHDLPVAQSRYALAVSLHAKGDLARAQHALYSLLGTLADSWPGLRAHCIAELISVAVKLGDDSDDLRKQLESAMGALAPQHAADLWEAQAETAHRNGQFAHALNASQQALVVREALAAKRHEAEARLSLGAAALREGREEDASAEFHLACALARDAGDANIEASSCVALAQMHTAAGRMNEAMRLMVQSQAAMRRFGQWPTPRRSHEEPPEAPAAGHVSPPPPMPPAPTLMAVGSEVRRVRTGPAPTPIRRVPDVEGPAAD